MQSQPSGGSLHRLPLPEAEPWSVTIDVPPELLRSMLSNAGLVREAEVEGEYVDIREGSLTTLEGQLRQAIGAYERNESDHAIDGHRWTLRRVLGACLADAGDDVHELCERPTPSLPRILGATEKVNWLALAINDLEVS
jgi:hypothetical protein